VDDQNYGLDLLAFLNDELDASFVGQIASSMQQEALKDERVRRASVQVSLTGADAFVAACTLTDAQGPFVLVLSVSHAGVTIVQAP
jgi:hypothetical protein